MNLSNISFVVLAGFVLCLQACSFRIPQKEQYTYIQRIIFDDEKMSASKEAVSEYGIYYLDSVFQVRPSIFPDKPYYGSQDTFLREGWKIVQPINVTIPDHWQEVYQYFNGDIESIFRQDTSVAAVIFYSPLLPTHEKGIFEMQTYAYQHTSVEGFWVWLLIRKVRRFRITRNDIEELELEYHDVHILF
jgi:hypothetical protein